MTRAMAMGVGYEFEERARRLAECAWSAFISRILREVMDLGLCIARWPRIG